MRVFLPVLGGPLLHAPVLRWDLFSSLARPLDCGATFRGRRLFGDNKTWRGALVMSTGIVLASAALFRVPSFRRGLPGGLEEAGPIRVGALLAAGTVAGELPNSFFKRQLGIEPGGRRWTPGGVALVAFDQADFVPAVWLALRPLWRMPVRDAARAFAVVAGVHMAINVAGYAIGARQTAI